MGILDEAIREHLELKRQHGADGSELQQLEDEAFGPPERPGAGQASDAAAEAPTEFMTAPETGEQPQQRQQPSVADLQEAPPQESAEEEEPSSDEERSAEKERQAIAEQPTEHFDVEEELGGSAEPGPSDEELVEEEISEPRLAPVDPLAAAELEEVEVVEEVEIVEAGPEDEDEEDEFWSEQRLSEELDQALDAPLEEEASVQPAEAEPIEEEPEQVDEDEEPASPAPASDSDVLEDTPEFLEDAPEDDELWFEQKPPKDFDFDD
jgi:hypothetical protein